MQIEQMKSCKLCILEIRAKYAETGHYPKFRKLPKVKAKVPAGIYLLNVKNKNARARCEIC